MRPNVSVALVGVVDNSSDGEAKFTITERSNSAMGYKLLLTDSKGEERTVSVIYARQKMRERRIALPDRSSSNGLGAVITLILRSN